MSYTLGIKYLKIAKLFEYLDKIADTLIFIPLN